jgi:hypothetical protein
MLILDGNFKFKINAFAYFCNYEVSDMAMGGVFSLTRHLFSHKKHHRPEAAKALSPKVY